MRPSYTARFEQDEDGVWCVVAQVAPLKTAFSDGPKLDDARRRIRESLALLLDVPEDSFDIVEELASVEPM